MYTDESIREFENVRQWRFIYDQPLAGANNMAVDEAILEHVLNGQSPPTIRLYTWSPPCLSLGYGQKTRDADLERIASFGWTAVRRPTGGRAILHTDELTYSVSVPEGHPLAQQDIISSYRQISGALVEALQSLGLTPSAERANELPKHPGAVCFEIPSHYEITVGGRKLVGSAQVRRRGGLLQHGSLPLTGDLARICDALAYPDDGSREAARGQVLARAITLSEALGHEVQWSTAASALAEAFETVFGVEGVQGQLSGSERAMADELAASRYATLDRVRTKVSEI
jgi:lipoyl(octanoyl) transferase